jgi:hypothetical protein
VSWLKLTGRKILLLFNRTEMLDTEAQESYAEFSRRCGCWMVDPLRVLVPLACIGADRDVAGSPPLADLMRWRSPTPPAW